MKGWGLTLMMSVMAVFLLGGCASANGPIASEVSSGVVESPLSEPSPSIDSDRLVSPFTYDDGFLRFDPPADGYTPAITSAEAYQAFLDTGAYPGIEEYSEPEFFLAQVTTYGEGSESDEGLGIGYDHVPVWVIRFINVPDDPAGPGDGPTEGDSPSPQTPVLQDVVIFVNADTGKALQLRSDRPDDVAQLSPPTAAPGKPSQSPSPTPSSS